MKNAIGVVDVYIIIVRVYNSTAVKPTDVGSDVSI